MAMPLKVVLIAETEHGVAFEVEVKSPGGAELLTPVRARLEAQGEALPRLLTRQQKQETPSPIKEVKARARASNEKKAMVVELYKQTCEELNENRRRCIEEACQQAWEKRDAALTQRSTQAGKHFEEAKAKANEHQKKLREQVVEQQRLLEEAASSVEKARNAALEQISAKAGKYFEHVLEKVRTFQAKTAEANAEETRKIYSTLAQAYEQRQKLLEDRRRKAGKHSEEALAKPGECPRKQADQQQQQKLEESMAVHGENRAATLAEKKAKASKHFSDAKAKGEKCHKQRRVKAAVRKLQLAKAVAQKHASHRCTVAECKAKAASHNALVAQKVLKHKQELQMQVQKLRSKLQEKAQRKPIRCGGGGPFVVVAKPC